MGCGSSTVSSVQPESRHGVHAEYPAQLKAHREPQPTVRDLPSLLINDVSTPESITLESHRHSPEGSSRLGAANPLNPRCSNVPVVTYSHSSDTDIGPVQRKQLSSGNGSRHLVHQLPVFAQPASPSLASDMDSDVEHGHFNDSLRSLGTGPRRGLTEALATFYPQSKDCNLCNAAATYTCEQCEDFFLCENCRVSDSLLNSHDPMHMIMPLLETHCESSRTFGDSNSTATPNGGFTSSLFYAPCYQCKRIIEDGEAVMRCDKCDFIICENCTSSADQHEHPLKNFKRRSSTHNVRETTLVNKKRANDGSKIINEYVVVKLLGRGSYAKVKLVQHTRTRELLALKILKYDRSQKKSGGLSTSLSRSKPNGGLMDEQDLLREIAVMKFVQHPNIVELREVIADGEANKVYIIMEYCEGGPIFTPGNAPLPLEKIRHYGRGILRALRHLHSQFLYHRDVKPANCLVGSDGVARLADFGTCNSRVTESNLSGSPAYSCPELMTGVDVAGEVADSWAFAIMLYQLAYAEFPLPSGNLYGLRNKLLSSEPLDFPTTISATNAPVNTELRDLLIKMLSKDLATRMLLVDAARHPFFQNDPAGEVSEAASTLSGTLSAGSSLSNDGGDTRASLLDLYAKALDSVHHGRNLKECFHGVRAMRRVRQKEARRAERRYALDMDSFHFSDHDALGTPSSSHRRAYRSSNTWDSDTAGTDPASLAAITTIVERHIETASDSLHFVRVPMEAPPAVIMDCATSAMELHMCYNGLKTVAPLNFARFIDLREVTITSNKLAAFPEELLAAPRLLRLDLSGNRIRAIPTSLRRARLLERLNLHNNLIENVGVDHQASGGSQSEVSVLALPTLRHVRLSANPLQHLPKGLASTTSLELVVDAKPDLLAEWSALVSACHSAPPPVVIIWDDHFPLRLTETPAAVWVASDSLRLYHAHTPRSCNAQHVVLFQKSDQRFPKGHFTSQELAEYFDKLSVVMGNFMIQQQRQQSPVQVPLSTQVIDAPVNPPHAANGSALRSLPLVVGPAAREYVSSFFFVAEDISDVDGGYQRLYRYIMDTLTAREPMLFFLTRSGSDIKDAREYAVAALSEVLTTLHGNPENLAAQMITVLDAIQSLYS